MGINHRRRDITMPQQFLNSTDIVTRLQDMRRKAVPVMPSSALQA
jgi:hypothetical protein